MLVTIVGKKDVDYISKKTGNPVKGISLYITRQPLPRESNVSGFVTDSIFISSSSPCFASLPALFTDPIEDSDPYDAELIYESDGRYSFLSRVEVLNA